MDTRRLILFVIFSFSILMLWDAWQQKVHPIINTPSTTQTTSSGAAVPVASGTQSIVNDGTFKLASGQRINVKTD